jgi:bifunctional non-homologous end joining protein LigD
LRALALTPFAKITGGKGMHVVTAIAGTTKNPPSWDDARAFARAFAEAAARASPARYVATMGKQHRGGKIFIDYLRNARMTTAVAPYSPRARPGATIAMPLAWNDVKKGLDPKSFTVASAAKWLKRADPWKDFARSAGSLETARKKLERVA